MSDLLNDARAEGAAEERANAAKSALMAGMTEEVAAEMASLQPAMHTVLVEALKKRERALQKRVQTGRSKSLCMKPGHARRRRLCRRRTPSSTPFRIP